MTLASTNVRHTAAMAADLKTASITVLSDSASVGDRLMAVLYCGDVSVTSGTADASAFTLPAGWSVTSLTSLIPTGDPRRLSGAIMVAEKTVTTAGVDASVFTWSCVQWRPLKLYKIWNQLTNGAMLTTHMQHTASLTTMRFTSIRGAKSQVLSRLANQPIVYPAVSSEYAVSGHVVRIGGVKQATAGGVLLPAAHSARALFGPLRYGGFDGVPQTGVTSLLLSTIDVTTVTTVADAAATARGDGFALSILVAGVVKPQVSFVTPTNGASADLTAGLPISWTTPTEGAQRYVSIYRENPPGSSSNIQWWNGTAWQAGAASVALTGQSATLPGFAATAGTTYRYLLAVWTDVAPDWSDYATLDLTHRVTPTAPTITITPTPSAGVVASRVPTMAVSGSTTDGGSITGWEAQWTDDATGAVLQSTTGPFPWALTEPLPNNTSVHARARFSQAGGTQWSAWRDVPLTITVAKPSAPTVALSTVTNPTSGLPLPQLLVTAAAGVTVRVERGGVVVGEAVSAGPSIALVDLACPSGPVTWTVTTVAATPYAERSLPTTVSGNLTPTVKDGQWLFDPTRPELAVRPRVRTLDSNITDLNASVFDAIGEEYALVQPGVPSAPRSVITVQHGDPAVIDKALALLKSGAPLMVRGWPEGGNVASQQADIVLRPYGEVQVERLTQGPFGFRRLTCAYVTAPAIAAGFAVIV